MDEEETTQERLRSSSAVTPERLAQSQRESQSQSEVKGRRKKSEGERTSLKASVLAQMGSN